jgi:hypothetical protein
MSHPLCDVHAFTIHHYEREKKIEEKASHAIAEVYRLEIAARYLTASEPGPQFSCRKN